MKVARQLVQRRTAGGRRDLRAGRRDDGHRQPAARALGGEFGQPRVPTVHRADQQCVGRSGPARQFDAVPGERRRPGAAEPGDESRRRRRRRVGRDEHRAGHLGAAQRLDAEVGDRLDGAADLRTRRGEPPEQPVLVPLLEPRSVL
jgi:hypothetical protein